MKGFKRIKGESDETYELFCIGWKKYLELKKKDLSDGD